MKQKLTPLLLILSYYCLGQNISINNSGIAPHSSAMLDVQSISKGMLVPRMDSSQRIAINTPANGLLVFDNNSGSFWFFEGSVWKDLSKPLVEKIHDEDEDTGIKVDNGLDNDEIHFSIAGTDVLEIKKDSAGFARTDVRNNGQNISIGLDAGKSLVTGDFANTIFGGMAFTNGSGSRNTVLGHLAGFHMNTGSNNTLIGQETGFFNTGGDNNTYLGRRAGRNSTSGNGNVFIGYSAGLNENGNNKLHIHNSLTSSPTGSLIYGEFNNALLRINGDLQIKDEYSFPSTDGVSGQVLSTNGAGSLTWTTPSSTSNNYWQIQGGNSLKPISGYDGLCVDCPGTTGNYATLGIGQTGTAFEEVLIKSDRRYALLIESEDVRTENLVDGAIKFEGAVDANTSTLYVKANDSTNPTVRIQNDGAGEGLYVISNLGNGINVFSGSNSDRIAANFNASSSSNSTGVKAFGTSVGVNASGNDWDFYAIGPGVDYGSLSSRRWKTDIRNIANPIEKIKRLRGVYYTWDRAHGGKHDIGFIAEEIAKEIPEIVHYEENGIGVLGLDYSKTTPLILEALRMHVNNYENKVQQLESILLKQEETNQLLIERLDRLEKK